MERAEARLRNSLKMSGDFSNDAERRLAHARALETNGNHLGAWYQYDRMVADLPESPEMRPYRLIAQREIVRLEGLRLKDSTDKVQSVSIDEFVSQAEEMILAGKEHEGREVFQRIISLYQAYPPAKDAVVKAQSVMATPFHSAGKENLAPSKPKTVQASASGTQEVRKPELNETATTDEASSETTSEPKNAVELSNEESTDEFVRTDERRRSDDRSATFFFLVAPFCRGTLARRTTRRAVTNSANFQERACRSAIDRLFFVSAEYSDSPGRYPPLRWELKVPSFGRVAIRGIDFSELKSRAL